MATLRAGFIILVFLLVTVVLIPVQVLLVRLPGRAWKRMARFYHRFLCWLFGIRVTVIGTPVRGGVLMTANHSGWLDIPILTSIAPVSFVAKAEVAQWALFGTLARLQQSVFIHRARSKAADDRDTVRRRLLAGDALVIFPEGTSSDGNRVLGFRSALLSAVEAVSDSADARYAKVQP